MIPSPAVTVYGSTPGLKTARSSPPAPPKIKMLVLQDCIDKLSVFKQQYGRLYGITKLGIFGSVARQKNTEESDIDIVVEVEKPTLSLMYELKEMLKALFKCEVDLIRFRSTLRPLFKSNILNDVIYV